MHRLHLTRPIHVTQLPRSTRMQLTHLLRVTRQMQLTQLTHLTRQTDAKHPGSRDAGDAAPRCIAVTQLMHPKRQPRRPIEAQWATPPNRVTQSSSMRCSGPSPRAPKHRERIGRQSWPGRPQQDEVFGLIYTRIRMGWRWFQLRLALLHVPASIGATRCRQCVDGGRKCQRCASGYRRTHAEPQPDHPGCHVPDPDSRRDGSEVVRGLDVSSRAGRRPTSGNVDRIDVCSAARIGGCIAVCSVARGGFCSAICSAQGCARNVPARTRIGRTPRVFRVHRIRHPSDVVL